VRAARFDHDGRVLVGEVIGGHVADVGESDSVFHMLSLAPSDASRVPLAEVRRLALDRRAAEVPVDRPELP
jgi:hypothetical protein